jgi:hypothetical protein
MSVKQPSLRFLDMKPYKLAQSKRQRTSAHCAGTTASRAIMHRSVYARFEALEVLLYDRFGKYRPPNLRNHVDFAQYYDGTPNLAPQCVADNVEDRYRAIVADEIGD